MSEWSDLGSVFKGIVTLDTIAQYNELKNNGSLTIGDVTIQYSPLDTLYITLENQLATNDIAGLVKGSNQDLKVSIASDGTMTVNGLEVNYKIVSTVSELNNLSPRDGLRVFVIATQDTYIYEQDQWFIDNTYTNVDKVKVDLINTSGYGNKFFSDDGTYKEINVDLDEQTISRNSAEELQAIGLTNSEALITASEVIEGLTITRL